ncbi:hypothetical protein QYM36_006367 [Artemia franciscana]|uniref:Uncharacterized protein n=1 Tax=Artemia franciscana TaxID=6661 RepID=A0AA88I3M2_ARTSF|nr:hypothetical protein QYM36_006367 [Artemia franciscana]
MVCRLNSELMKTYYEHCKSTSSMLGEETKPFNVEKDWVQERALSSFNGVMTGLGVNISDLDYADDIGALVGDPTTVQAMLNEIATG